MEEGSTVEKWKAINFFPRCQVSNLGCVKRIENGSEYSVMVRNNRVLLRANGCLYSTSIAILIYVAFAGIEYDRLKRLIMYDNTLCNLRVIKL